MPAAHDGFCRRRDAEAQAGGGRVVVWSH
jgi:hypothetical protein